MALAWSVVCPGPAPIKITSAKRRNHVASTNGVPEVGARRKRFLPNPDKMILGRNFRWLRQDEKELLVRALREKYPTIHIGLLPFVKIEDVIDALFINNKDLSVPAAMALLFRVSKMWFAIFIVLIPIAAIVDWYAHIPISAAKIRAKLN